MKCQFIEQYTQEFPIVAMCLESRKAAFTPGASALPGPRQREDAQLTEEIKQVFVTHRGRYGSPRIYRELKDQGRRIARKRVARLMREAQLSALRKRRRVQTTKRDTTHPVAPNVFNREFTAPEPDTKWVTDITYIPTTQGWLYLAVMLDCIQERLLAGLYRPTAMKL